MIKNNKWKLIISSLIIISPIFVGLILWNKFPESFPIHWDIDGNINRWSSKAVAIFLLPCILFVVHWICILITSTDPKNKEQNSKVVGMIFWILPIISLIISGQIYSTALKKETMLMLMPIIPSLIFIVMGNYLPKVKQNHTIGIKVIWTLDNEENWNKTHRLCGKLWVVGGFILMLSIFLPQIVMIIVMISIIIILIIVPIIYSYCLYRKHLKNNKYDIENKITSK